MKVLLPHKIIVQETQVPTGWPWSLQPFLSATTALYCAWPGNARKQTESVTVAQRVSSGGWFRGLLCPNWWVAVGFFFPSCHVHVIAFCQPSQGTPHLPSPLPRASLIIHCLGLYCTLGFIPPQMVLASRNHIISSIKGYNLNMYPTHPICQSLLQKLISLICLLIPNTPVEAGSSETMTKTVSTPSRVL